MTREGLFVGKIRSVDNLEYMNMTKTLGWTIMSILCWSRRIPIVLLVTLKFGIVWSQWCSVFVVKRPYHGIIRESCEPGSFLSSLRSVLSVHSEHNQENQ